MNSIYVIATFVLVCCGTVLGRNIEKKPITFTFDDLHLEDVNDVSTITPSFLIKRATDAIVFRDNDVEDRPLYDFKYATDTHNHEERGFLVNGEKMVIGAFGIRDPTTGFVQMTMYTADKDGFHPQVRFGIDESLLKSAVGK